MLNDSLFNVPATEEFWILIKIIFRGLSETLVHLHFIHNIELPLAVSGGIAHSLHKTTSLKDLD